MPIIDVLLSIIAAVAAVFTGMLVFGVLSAVKERDFIPDFWVTTFLLCVWICGYLFSLLVWFRVIILV